MRDKIQDWIRYIQTPNLIGEFPICPYAAKAMANRKFGVYPIEDLNSIDLLIEAVDTSLLSVAIFYLVDFEKYSVEELKSLIADLNKRFLSQNKVVLDSDPRDPFIINGHQTTFDGCYLILVQDLADLNKHSEILGKTSYYDYWSSEQYNEVVAWRK